MKINYPTKKSITNNSKSHFFKSQGMVFENELNISNEYYIKHKIANIHKKPTPVQVVKVDYPARNKAKIVEAYYKLPSTTDYNGIYREKYIDYEAKETQNSAFYFKFIHEHQVDHLLNIDDLGGIAFVIIYFKKENEIYIIDIKEFYRYYKDDNYKCISIEMARLIGKSCNIGYTPPIDYLKAVDELYFKQKENS